MMRIVVRWIISSGVRDYLGFLRVMVSRFVRIVRIVIMVVVN